MRRKVLLVQPSMQPPGGGNGVAAWMLQALAAEHDVTVLSWWAVEVDPINRFFGTALRAGDFRNHVVPESWRRVPDSLPVPAALLRSSLLMRYTRRVTDGFDVMVGVHNETDYGRRAIQYVHYPTYLRPRPQVDLRWYHRFRPLLNVYYAAADRLADFSLERMKANLTLANSDWTASHLCRFLGIDARTVYPPVVAADQHIPWSDRRRAFVAMGRISPEKDYGRVMRIVARVRQHVPELTLVIIGTWDATTSAYRRELQALARALDPHGAWISLRNDLARHEVQQVLASCRYGIHGMREEHFGMAPAEMVRAGMIVWVPDGGGQVEIVGDAPPLRFATDDAAVESITSLLTNPAEERRWRDHLAVQGERFGTERFMHDVREIVREFRE